MAKGFFSRFTRSEPVPAPEPSPVSSVPPPAPVTPDVAKVVRRIARQELPAVPRKEAISLRLDADVLDWFRARGPGYQTRINAVLRAYKDAAG
jgi:uncharacterized protein (DUF4415 family)